MSQQSRRNFLIRSNSLAAGLALTESAIGAENKKNAKPVPTQTEVDLCGQWQFRTDSVREWTQVQVPHTWQIESALAEYRGVAWYQRSFDVPEEWAASTVRIEFESVFHSATVSINGKPAGDHLRKAYTAFALDITAHLEYGKLNTLLVKVDNTFDEHMLPRGRSSDWAHDGGIYRPVRLLVTPKSFIERVDIDAIPDFGSGNAELNVAVFIRNTAERAVKGQFSLYVVDDETGVGVLSVENAGTFAVPAKNTATIPAKLTLPKAKLWHFDQPSLYRLEARLDSSSGGHRYGSIFGVRKLEVKSGAFYFNNEKVFLMGVERMAGSNPEYGMAEPASWIDHDHDDLKHLNCIFTRVHWPQDKRVLDYCDRRGILLQSEVPTWGPNTFKGMGAEPDADIMQNGLEQLNEMAARDRNHPCIVSWGLCNEINGQNPPAYQFAKNMLAEAKRIDPHRLCSYASHSLFHTQAKDVSGLMDFVECNQYIGSWQQGGAAELDKLMEEIHAAFPDKVIVISEYGYCACTADRPEGDGHREQILQTQDAILRTKPYVGGAIFFCYNDYRTHVGDRGSGVMKQRVHGVVDLYGKRKNSYELLRAESSPVEAVTVTNSPKSLAIRVSTRKTLPAYKLKGYQLRSVFYGPGDIPILRKNTKLPDLDPGGEAQVEIAFENGEPLRADFDVMRPTGFSALTAKWTR